MNNICTSIEQSQKLIKVGIDINTADMYWEYDYNNHTFNDTSKVLTIRNWDDNYNKNIPAWSISTLLELMPFHLIVNNQRYAFSMHKGFNKDGETYMFRYNIFNTDICLYSTGYYNNSIDACVEMICLLKENNKL